VNKTTLELYRAESKEDLLKNLAAVLCDESYEQYREELVYIAEGRTHFSWEGINQTVDGRRLDVGIYWSAAPGHEDDLSRVIVSIEDVTGRKQTEEALFESEEKNRYLFEHSLEGIGLSIGNQVIDANQALLEIFGYADDKEGFLNKPLLEHVAPELRKLIQDIQKENRKSSPTPRRFEYKIVHKSGEIRDLEISVAPVGIKGATYSLSTFRDITERKRAEEKIRQRAEELAALQAIVLEITSQHEPEKLLLAIVERAAHLLKAEGGGLYLCDPERREARCVISYNTPHDYTGVILKYGEGAAGVVAQTGQPLRVDDYRAWSGRATAFDEEKPFRALVSAPILWQGQVTGVIHALRYSEGNPFTQEDQDLLVLFANHAAIASENARLFRGLQSELVERRRAEEELRRSEERIQNIIQHSSSMFYAHSPKHVLTYVSPQSRDLLDCEPEEAMVRWQEFLSENPLNEAGIVATERAIQTGQRQSPYELELITRKGRKIWVRVDESPVVQEGKTVAIVGSITDITERKQAEKALAESERFLRQTIDLVPHFIFAKDRESRFLLVNKAVADAYGTTTSDIVGKSDIRPLA
jgi:PAS domain S-box-containing protein